MLTQQKLKIAIQKKGRLNDDSLALLSRCGIKFHVASHSLIVRSENLPLDILFVRDDDIPTLVMDGICDLGIVGENVLLEKEIYQQVNDDKTNFKLIKKLNFGLCRLSIAAPAENGYDDLTTLDGKRIATSYPGLLQKFLFDNNIDAEILTISGSVEIAPKLGMADAICDLVSTGRTLEENNLTEVAVITKSQAVLIRSNKEFSQEKLSTVELLLRRICGVTTAQESKYIMFHAPKSALAVIKNIMPGFESPTIMNLDGLIDKVAVHVVSSEGVFWSTLEKLKQLGASSILVLPIEKMLD